MRRLIWARVVCIHQNILLFLANVFLVVPSLLNFVPTLDGYDNHMNRETIDLYLDGKTPKFNIRVDNQRKFRAVILCPLESLICVSMRCPEMF